MVKAKKENTEEAVKDGNATKERRDGTHAHHAKVTEQNPEVHDSNESVKKEPLVEFGAKTAIPKEQSKADENELKQTELVEAEKYLNTGSHIGTKFKSGDMKRYIYKVRKDGLNVLDVQVLDERLEDAAKFLAKFQGDKIAVVSRKSYGQTPVRAFAEAIGGVPLTGRFVPGTFTNPQCTRYVEPKVVVITDPEYDVQPIEEATGVRIPVVAFVSTNNTLKNIDVAIPINNKGRKSLALGYWILAKEILKERGDLKSGAEFTKTPDDFEYKMKEGEEEEQRRAFERGAGRRGGFRGRGRFGQGFRGSGRGSRGGGFQRFVSQ